MASLLLLASCAAGPAAPAGTLLEWRLDPGLKLRYELAHAVDLDLGGMPLKQDLLFGLSMEVLERSPEGVAAIKVTVDRIRLKMQGTMESQYDSDDGGEPEDAASSFVAALKGRSVQVRMDRRGSVSSVTGAKELLEEASKQVEGEGGAVIRAMKSVLSDRSLRQLLDLLTPDLPEGRVLPGASWTGRDKWRLHMLGDLRVDSRSTFTERRGSEALVRRDLEVKVDSDEDSIFEVRTREVAGSYTWAADRGLLLRSRAELNLMVGAQGQEYPVDVRISLSLAPRQEKK